MSTGPASPRPSPRRGPPRGRAPARREGGHRAATARLARPPAPQRGMAWTGDEPLVAGDYIAWRAGGTVHHAAVAFPGDTGGMRASDTLLLRIAGPADGTALDDAGRIVEIGAPGLCGTADAPAPPGPTRGSGSWKPPGSTPCPAPPAGSPVPSPSRATASPGPRPPAGPERCGRSRPWSPRGPRPPTGTRSRSGRSAPQAPARRSPAARSGAPPRRSPRAAASAPPGPTRPGASAYSTRRRRSRSRP